MLAVVAHSWDKQRTLDLALDVVDGVRRLHFERDRLAGERLYKDLHGCGGCEGCGCMCSGCVVLSACGELSSGVRV
jgi:hypothetical protein